MLEHLSSELKLLHCPLPVLPENDCGRSFAHICVTDCHKQLLQVCLVEAHAKHNVIQVGQITCVA